MVLHPTTFSYLQPTQDQLDRMCLARQAAADYAGLLEILLPDGADKTFILRAHRTNAMWANLAITREADGTPRRPLDVSDPAPATFKPEPELPAEKRAEYGRLFTLADKPADITRQTTQQRPALVRHDPHQDPA